MAFAWTLQFYIFREMGKVFLLTAVALTGVLGLGGGVLNMIKLGDATPEQLFRLMALVLPVAIALTLPIAALFSAAAIYGRFSADNEFLACRGSGINLQHLLLPAVVLSLVSACVTFAFINFLIPGIVRNLNEFIGADVATLIERRLDRPQGMSLGKSYRIAADDTTVDASHPDQVTLNRVTFVEVDGEEWVRFGSAREVNLNFAGDDARQWVYGSMNGLSFFDHKADRFTDLESQVIRSIELPSLVPLEIKFLDLGELLYYWSRPDEWRTVERAMSRLRTATGRWVVYDALTEDWVEDKEIVLKSPAVRFTLHADAAARVPREGSIQFTAVTIEEDRRGSRRTYTADRAILELGRGDTLEECEIRIDVYDVRIVDGQRRFQRAKDRLGPIGIAADLKERVARIPQNDLLQPAAAQADEDPWAVMRLKAVEERAQTLRAITGTIHQRMAFSVSVIFLVTLGAVLGIFFRGSQAVTAFGISFVPSLVVIVTIVMGKQMASNAPTHTAGLMLIWSGIVLVVAIDAWLLTRRLWR